MADVKPCCPNSLPPVVSNYKGVGKKIQLDDFELYVTGSGSKAILFVYDIFGYHPNAFQVADHLANAGYTVYIPDVFRGKPMPVDPFPGAGGWPEVMAWINSHTWDKVKPVLTRTIAYAKEHGAKDIGGVGFCWGAKQVWNLAAEGSVSVAASAHPSFMDLPEVQKAQAVPQCILAAKDDPPFVEVEKFLTHESKLASKNVFKRFPDVHHGWLGARGAIATASDYSQKNYASAAAEGISMLVSFFQKNL